MPEYPMTEKSWLLDADRGSKGHINGDVTNRSTEEYSAIKTKDVAEPDGQCAAVNNDADCDKVIDIEQNKHKITNCQTLMHLVKSCLGSAMLMAPNAFSDGGLWVGLGGVFLCTVLLIEGMQTLARCSNYLTKRVSWPDSAMDYGDVAEYSFKLGPNRFRRFALPARFLVKLQVVIIQLGTCAMYFIFVPSVIKGIVHQAYPDDPVLIVYMAGMLAIVLPYSLITSLRHLALTSTLGNILLFVAFGLILGYLVTDLPSVDTRPAFQSWDRIPFLISKAMFAVDGIGSILPLMSKMHTPEDFGGFSGVLLLGMVIPISIYAAIGFYGYLRYGDAVDVIITLNLPQNHGLTISCEIMLAVALLMSFGIEFYVPVVQMWPWIEAKLTDQMWKTIGEFVFRIILVLLTFGFAVAVPHLDLMLALFGAVAAVGLGLIFPPLIDIMCLTSQSEDLPLFRLIKNIAILIFGITVSLIGTYVAARDIILTF